MKTSSTYITTLEQANYVIRKMGLKLPENTMLVGDDGLVLYRRGWDDPPTVAFIDLSDRWHWTVSPGELPMDARTFMDKWQYLVDEWHRMMEEKHAA